MFMHTDLALWLVVWLFADIVGWGWLAFDWLFVGFVVVFGDAACLVVVLLVLWVLSVFGLVWVCLLLCASLGWILVVLVCVAMGLFGVNSVVHFV